MKKSYKLDTRSVEYAAKKIRTLSHPRRIEIVKLLEQNEQMSVTQIYERLNIIQAETSHHLALLKDYGILKKVRMGKKSIYSINQKALEDIISVSEELNKLK
ncbi:MAG: metalloregulator ArsR/SmtB family transcription factor [Bacteroidota bacterium]